MDIFGGTGINGAQEWNDIKAELVAGCLVLKVGGVGDVGLAPLSKVCLNVGTTHIEQWAEDMPIAWTYSGNTTDTCAAHHIHQHSLHIVISVMCHEDCFGTNIYAQLFEIVIAQCACRHLDTHLMQ